MESSDLSNNQLKGDIPVNGSFSLFTPIRLVQIILFISNVIVEGGNIRILLITLLHLTVIQIIQD